MRVLAGAAWLAALVLPLAALAGEGPARALHEHQPGYAEYRRYCASCHGIFADGKGPVAPALKTPPADLTRLGERYGMPLPRNKLLPFIDGRGPARAHGTHEMPVWGKLLYDDLGSGAREREMAVRGTILLILEYLESVQRPAPGARDPAD
jgi:mono/diheme cytochrome c family protein